MAILTSILSRLRSLCRRAPAAWAFLLLLFCCVGQESQGQNGSTREYEVKAVFVFNFAQFIDWPSNEFSSPSDPLVIGIIGDDPFGPYIDETVRGEKVSGHPLVVRRFARLEDITSCQILFVSASAAKDTEAIVNTCKNHGILTVSDSSGFCRKGGIIRFVTENNKIRLHIDLEAARAEKLNISSRLLRLADIVPPGKD